MKGEKRLEDALRILTELSQDQLVLSPDEFLKRIADQARRLVAGAVCVVWRLDYSANVLRVVAASPILTSDFEAITLDPALPHLAEAKLGYLSDVQKPSSRYEHPQLAGQRGWVSLLTAPLKAGGHLIGMLDVYTDSEYKFTPTERNAFEAFASQASLYLWTQDVEAEHVIQAYEGVRAAATPTELSRRIIQWNVDRLQADYGHIRLVDSGTRNLVFAAGSGKHGIPSPYGLVDPPPRPVGVRSSMDEPYLDRRAAALDTLKRRLAVEEAILAGARTEQVSAVGPTEQPFGILRLFGPIPQVPPSISRAEAEDAIRTIVRDLGVRVRMEQLGELLLFADLLEQRFLSFLQTSLEIFGGCSAHVRLLDRPRRSLVHIAGAGPLAHYMPQRLRQRLGQDVVSRVVNSRTRVILHSLNGDAEWANSDFAGLKKLYQSDKAAGRITPHWELDKAIDEAVVEAVVPIWLRTGRVIGSASLVANVVDEEAARDFNLLMNQAAQDIEALSSRTSTPAWEILTIVTTFRERLADVLDEMARTRGLSHCEFWLIDRRGDSLRLLAASSRRHEVLSPRISTHELPEYEQVMASGVTSTGNVATSPQFVHQVRSLESKRRIVQEYQTYLGSIESELRVPLTAEGRLVGTAALQSSRAHYFSKADRRMFTNSMTYAAELIAQAQLAEQISQLQEELKRVPDAHHLQHLLHHIARSAVQLLGADIVAIHEYDGSVRAFVMPPVVAGVLIWPAKFSGEIREEWLPYLMVREWESMPAEARRSNDSRPGEFFEEDVNELQRFRQSVLIARAQSPRKHFATIERTRSAAGLVLDASDQALGVIFFNFRSPQIFSASRRQLMRFFASVAAIAIRNDRVHRSAHERELRNGRPDVSQVIRTLAETLKADFGHIRMLNPVTGSLELVAVYADVPSHPAQPVLKRGEGVAGAVFNRMAPVIVADVRSEHFHPPENWEGDESVRSFACVPLVSNKRPVGTCFLGSSLEGIFRLDSQAALEQWSAFASEHIGRLFEQLEARRRLERVTELDDILKSEHTSEQKVALILTVVTMSGGLAFNRALLFLRDDDQLVCRYAISPKDEADAQSQYIEWSQWQTDGLELTLTALLEKVGVAQIRRNLRENWGPGGSLLTCRIDSHSLLARSWREQVGVSGPVDGSDDLLAALGANSYVVVPVSIGDRALGVLFVDNRFSVPARATDLSALTALRPYVQRLALAIEEGRQALEARTLEESRQKAESARWSTPFLGHDVLQVLDDVDRDLDALETTSPSDRELIARVSDRVRSATTTVRLWMSVAKRGRFPDQYPPQAVAVDELLKELSDVVGQVLGDLPVVEPLEPTLASMSVRIHLDMLRLDFENFAKDSLRYRGLDPLRVRLVCELALPRELVSAKLPAAPFIKIVYRDNGKGIPMEEREKVFDGGRTSGDGEGIGLAKARYVAKEHGGSLRLAETEGEGVCFEMYLPALVYGAVL